MELSEHELYIISKTWLFDLTTFTGYQVETDKDGKPVRGIKAFRIEDTNRDCNFKNTRFISNIPLGVIRKAQNVIRNYYKEALINI